MLDWQGCPISREPDSIKPSVSAVIFNDAGMICLQKRSDIGFWGIPGGQIEIGESVEDGVRREVCEETGLVMNSLSLVGIYSAPESMVIAVYPTGGIVHYVNICFRGDVAGGNLTGSDEGEEVGFFAPDQMPLETLPGHRLRIQDALEQSGSAGVPVIR